jgi:hypothetical protein
MSDPSVTPDSLEQEAAAWDDAERPVECEPVATPLTPRVVLPQPRRFDEPASRQEGLRIEPRKVIRPNQENEPRKLKVNEHGLAVIRLESEAPPVIVTRDETMPQLRPEDAKPRVKQSNFSAEWGKASTQSLRWLWWSAGGVVALIVIGLAAQPFLIDKDQDRTAVTFQPLEVVEDVIPVEDPTVFFSENSAQVIAEIHETLGIYARANTLAEALPVIRHAGGLSDPLAAQWRSWHVPADWSVSDSDTISYDSVGKLPYAIISGTRPDFSTYQVFLVRENDRMLIDWEATVGLGTRSFPEMNQPATHSAEIRVVMAPSGFHTQTFPEVRYRAYRLASTNSEDLLWGYAERGSPAALALADIFNEKAVFSDKPNEQLVRLRLIRGDSTAKPNQWLILDVLHKGWVTP